MLSRLSDTCRKCADTHGKVKRRTGPETPMGEWIARMVERRKLPSKEALRRKIEVALPTFNDWQRADTVAVPQQRIKQRIVDRLNLTNAEREELEEAIVAQVHAVPGDARPSPPERTIERDDEYTHRPAAIALLATIPKYEPVLAALRVYRAKEEDPTVHGWRVIADELLAERNAAVEEGLGDEERTMERDRLEALAKKGRKKR